MSNDLALKDLLDVQDFFGLPSPALVEKDYHVARALAAIAAVDTGRLRLVFSGGTALGRAHKLIQRMSEDIDLKIVAHPAPTRPELRGLRDVISSALLGAGFAFDPQNPEHVASRNSSQYTIYKLPYRPSAEGQGILRPEIQIETAVWPVRLPTIDCSVRSFYAEAFKQAPEIEKICCVSIPETAAEKFIALTRRVAAEQNKEPKDRDKTLVRHIYDLQVIRAHYDITAIVPLITQIIQADAIAYGNQYPPYREDPLRETWRALDILGSDPHYAAAYEELNRDMVYGEKASYADGITLLRQMAIAVLPTSIPPIIDDEQLLTASP